MKFVTTFDPTTASSGTIPVGTGDPGQKVLIYNESAVTIALNFDNGQTTYIHAWEANYWTLQLPTYEIEWSAVRNLVGAGQAPANFVDVFIYDVGEPIEGVYPVQLARLINTGNQVTPVATSSSLVNDNNSSNTQIIEATQSGSSGSNVSIDNSGNMAIKQYVGAALTTLLQTIANAGSGSSVKLGTASSQVEVVGNLLVDGNTTFTNPPSFSTLTCNTIDLTVGSLTRIAILTGVLNSSPKSFNHSLGATPDFVAVTCTNSALTEIIAWTASSSTTITLASSVSGSNLNFTALLIKF